MNSIFKEFDYLYVEKKTLSTALGFEPRSDNRKRSKTSFFSTERFLNSLNLVIPNQLYRSILIKIETS